MTTTTATTFAPPGDLTVIDDNDGQQHQLQLMSALHPQYVIDANGKRLSVLLPLAEYESLMELLEDFEDSADAREILARIERGEENTLPWETIKAEYGL